MPGVDPLVFFWLLLKASLFSTGGTGNLPSLHQDLIARGWAGEQQFAESLLVGQVAPGPMGLWVISLGYFTDGLRGALLALVAILLPPVLVLQVERLYHRVKDHPAIEGFVRGMSLALLGVFGVVLFRLLQHNGLDVRSVLIAAAAFGLAASRRAPVIIILALAAVAGMILYR